MNGDLGTFEKELKGLFADPPMPEGLEPGRVAEALKARPAVKEAPAPAWKKPLALAAAAALICAAGAVTVISVSRRSSASVTSGMGESYYAQSTVSGSETESGTDHDTKESAIADESAGFYGAEDAGGALTVAIDGAGVPMPEGLDEAVSAALLLEGKAKSAGDFVVEAHSVLASEDSEQSITIYLLALTRVYGEADGWPVVVSETGGVEALAFDKTEGGFELTSQRTPGRGEDAAVSAGEVLPAELADYEPDAGASSALAESCDAQALRRLEES